MIVHKTLRLAVDANAIDSPESTASLLQAAALLRQGGTVAFPTETVYGLGANALDSAAVQSIFEAKQRPAWDPLIVHVVSEDQLGMVAVNIPPTGRLLMEAFWPGPLTLLLPKSPLVPAIVTAGRARVGVRMPASSRGPQIDRTRGCAGRRAQREFLRQNQPHARGVCP